MEFKNFTEFKQMVKLALIEDSWSHNLFRAKIVEVTENTYRIIPYIETLPTMHTMAVLGGFDYTGMVGEDVYCGFDYDGTAIILSPILTNTQSDFVPIGGVLKEIIEKQKKAFDTHTHTETGGTTAPPAVTFAFPTASGLLSEDVKIKY
jgi:hypothetical protein